MTFLTSFHSVHVNAGIFLSHAPRKHFVCSQYVCVFSPVAVCSSSHSTLRNSAVQTTRKGPVIHLAPNIFVLVTAFCFCCRNFSPLCLVTTHVIRLLKFVPSPTPPVSNSRSSRFATPSVVPVTVRLPLQVAVQFATHYYGYVCTTSRCICRLSMHCD
jgi:hypothetical protein